LLRGKEVMSLESLRVSVRPKRTSQGALQLDHTTTRREGMNVRMLSLVGHSSDLQQSVGHPHFWDRALARRQFLTTAAGTLGLVLSSGGLGAGLWRPQWARAADPASTAPNPIPGGIQPFGPGTEVFHIILPGPGTEPSTITDFHGFVGVAHITGFGTATPGNRRLFFDTDMRFMKGPYLGMDGRQHNGTFGFF